MAMRPRPDSGIIRAIRPKNQPEDFRPLSEWKQGQGADILLVHIPGFTKEQIKVTFESSSMLKALGERPLENNRWSRFNQDYRIPEDCNVRGIHAMFEGGILSITMPKKIVPSEPTHEAKTTQHPPSTEPKPEKSSEDKKSVVDTPRPPKVDANKDREEKSDKYPSPKKASTETNPEKSLEDRKTVVDTPTVQKTEGEQPKHLKGQDNAKPEKSSKEPVKKIIEDSTPAAKIKDFSGDNKSDNVSGGHGEDKAGGDQLENFNKIVQGLITKIKEGRGPLVNVGVAVLIIVALGVYMFSGKAKN